MLLVLLETSASVNILVILSNYYISKKTKVHVK